MSTPVHVLMMIVLVILAKIPLYWGICFFIIPAAVPDLVGWIEKKIYNNNNLWNFYKEAHKLKIYYILLPGWFIHILLDKFTHKEGGGGWNKLGWLLEWLSWTLLPVILFQGDTLLFITILYTSVFYYFEGISDGIKAMNLKNEEWWNELEHSGYDLFMQVTFQLFIATIVYFISADILYTLIITFITAMIKWTVHDMFVAFILTGDPFNVGTDQSGSKGFKGFDWDAIGLWIFMNTGINFGYIKWIVTIVSIILVCFQV